MQRNLTIAIGVFAAILIAIRLRELIRRETAASVAFTHFGTLPGWWRTNQMCGFFMVSNAGPRRLIFRGVGASSEQQVTQVLTREGWVTTNCWLSPGAAYFCLDPGQSREVPVSIEDNVSWKIRFRFRESGFVDVCPEFIWSILPERLQELPTPHYVWTEPVEAYVTK